MSNTFPRLWTETGHAKWDATVDDLLTQLYMAHRLGKQPLELVEPMRHHAKEMGRAGDYDKQDAWCIAICACLDHTNSARKDLWASLLGDLVDELHAHTQNIQDV